MQWEYKVVQVPSETTLNQLGLTGWELVAVNPNNFYILKRPLRTSVRLG